MYLAEQLNIKAPSPEQQISPTWLTGKTQTLYVKRDDLIHPIISGNKWRKLCYALLEAQEHQVKHIMSFGGGFSNHLHALGYCCHKLNIHFTALVRGNYSLNPSPMLRDLQKWQHSIQYLDRLSFQKRADSDYLNTLQKDHPDALIIPEGGSQSAAIKGVAEIVQELTHSYDYIIAPVASGGTLAGLITGVAEHCPSAQVIGMAVLKGQDYLENLVQALLSNDIPKQPNWQIEHNYHFGGYAKTNNELDAFCTDFYQQTQIPIEPVYSGKLFYGVKSMLQSQLFPGGSRLLVIHTGGLQGAR